MAPGSALRETVVVLRRCLGRLARDTSGGVIMEFAFVGPPLVAIILAIIHTALVFLAQQGLETAAQAAGRLIMTGQAQQAVVSSGGSTHTSMTATDFKNAVCGNLQVVSSGNTVSFGGRLLPPFLACDRLYVDVQTYASFSAAVTSAPTMTYSSTSASATVTNSFSYSASSQGASTLAGSPTQVVVVRLMYLWPTATGPFGLNLTNQQNGNRLIYATTMLVTESYCNSPTVTNQTTCS